MFIQNVIHKTICRGQEWLCYIELVAIQKGDDLRITPPLERPVFVLPFQGNVI